MRYGAATGDAAVRRVQFGRCKLQPARLQTAHTVSIRNKGWIMMLQRNDKHNGADNNIEEDVDNDSILDNDLTNCFVKVKSSKKTEM